MESENFSALLDGIKRAIIILTVKKIELKGSNDAQKKILPRNISLKKRIIAIFMLVPPFDRCRGPIVAEVVCEY